MKLAGIGGTPQIGLLPSRGITCERPINDMFFESDINNYNWLFEKDGPWESNHNVSKRSVQAYIKFISEIINENICGSGCDTVLPSTLTGMVLCPETEKREEGTGDRIRKGRQSRYQGSRGRAKGRKWLSTFFRRRRGYNIL